MRLLYSLTLLAGLLLAGRICAQPASDLYRQTSDVHHLLTQYEADRGSLSRFYVVTNAPERRERMQQFYTDYLSQLARLNFDRMPTDSRVDYLLLRRNLEEELRDLDDEAREVTQIRPWFPFADQIYTVEKQRRRGAVLNAEQLAADLEQIGDQITQARRVVTTADKAGKLDPALIRRAAGTVRGLRSALTSVFTFYKGYDPLFSWWVPKPYERVDSLLRGYGTFFERKARGTTDSSGIAGVPIGREELIR